MTAKEDAVHAGQAVYTKRTLAVYDLVVLALSNRWIWRCPTSRLKRHYEEHVSDNHLDVGVGTGYFPDRCRFPSASSRIALMDLNPTTLEFSARRIKRYTPETYQQNILQPIEQKIAPFDSVAMNYLLHCVPGSFEEKGIAFDHLLPLMKPGATLFGSTILHEGIRRSGLARKLMAVYNAKGIFSNEEDDLAGLEKALGDRFETVKLETVGCVALFSARKADR